MTDEERRKLVADLREFTGLDNEPWLVRVGRGAANEIERLAKENGRLTQALIDKLAAYSAKDNAMTAAKALEAIGLNDATVAALLKELKENAMTKSNAEPQDPLPREHQDPSKWPTRETVERAHALAQSNVEPVAWQFRYRVHQGHEWTGWDMTDRPDYWRKQPGAEVRPLYIAPPRPDADSDGVTRKDVEGWMRYFDEHAEEFVAAHEAILRKAAR
jgi:hypothetical protein